MGRLFRTTDSMNIFGKTIKEKVNVDILA